MSSGPCNLLRIRFVEDLVPDQQMYTIKVSVSLRAVEYNSSGLKDWDHDGIGPLMLSSTAMLIFFPTFLKSEVFLTLNK